MRRPTIVALALAALAPSAVTLSASVRHVHRIGGEDLAAQLEADCADRTSPACAAAIDSAAGYAEAILGRLAERTDRDVRPIARRAATSALAPLRAAAAAALASPFAAPEDTPLLLGLADDPVPAVRAAALRSLRSSPDPRAQLVARRAGAFDDRRVETPAETPDAAVAAARVGVPLPADATFLYFASGPGTGRYSYWTARSPADVAAALRGKAKQGPLTPDEFRAQAEAAKAGPDLEEGQMPSADDMARAMAMAEQMMKAMESAGAQGGTPEEQAAAMQRAAGGMASFDADLAGIYEEAELFGDARLFVVPVAGSSDAVVAVYRDVAVGGTGVTVHRTPLPRP